VKTTTRDRQIVLREIVQTPKALPGFDLAAFRALERAEQARRWAGWSEAERLRVAHAAMAAKRGYSDEAGAALFLERLSERLGGA
jgi:hypothetical protein